MVKHERLTDTIFKVTYESGSIYINYGDEDYTLEDGTVILAENGLYVPEV